MTEFSIAVIRLSGDIEIGRRDEIRAVLQVPEGATAVLLDFSAVTYADSTALAELLRFRSEAEKKAMRVAILTNSTKPQFARLLAYAGLQDAFAVYADRAAALNYLGTPAI